MTTDGSRRRGVPPAGPAWGRRQQGAATGRRACGGGQDPSGSQRTRSRTPMLPWQYAQFGGKGGQTAGRVFLHIKHKAR